MEIISVRTFEILALKNQLLILTRKAARVPPLPKNSNSGDKFIDNPFYIKDVKGEVEKKGQMRDEQKNSPDRKIGT